MSYLRGNSVVDGNLYVEGDLLVRDVRPAENGKVVAFKDENNALIPGRHVRSESGDTGSLIDSSIVETKPENSSNVEFFFTWDNTINNPNPVSKITIKNSIDKLYVEDAALKAMNNSSTEVSDFNKYADTITSWSY